MPHSCCAVGCTNRKVGKNSSLPFYGIPRGRTPIEKRRRDAWLRAIRREDWKTWSYDRISKAKLCGEHFISGKRSEDPENPDWVPTVFRHTTTSTLVKIAGQQKRKARYQAIKEKREKSFNKSRTDQIGVGAASWSIGLSRTFTKMDSPVKGHGHGSIIQSSFTPVLSDVQHQEVDQSFGGNNSENCEMVKEEVYEVLADDPQEALSNDALSCKEEIPDAVEFLSVECDMILEPECDLETGNHLSYKSEQGKRERVQTNAVPRGSNPVLPILYQLPLIAELFRYRDVDVYKRTCKDGPFVKIFNPESSVSNGLNKDKNRAKQEFNNNEQVPDVRIQEGKGNVSCSEQEISPGERSTKDNSDNNEDDVPSKCEICQKQCVDKNALMAHKLTHIIVSGKSYPCTVCEATFTSKASLRSHVQRHFNLKNVKCPFCEKKFQSNSQLVIHQRIHSGEKPFQCQYCEKAFSYKFQFDNHEKIHTGKGLLKCEYCDATFTQKQALVVHERKHTGEKPFKCEKCGAAFRVRSYLRAHKKCHMDRKPRECPDCGSQFWKSSALKKHRKAEHDI